MIYYFDFAELLTLIDQPHADVVVSNNRKKISQLVLMFELHLSSSHIRKI